MLISLVVGMLLAIATVVIHSMGTTWWIQRLQRHSECVAQEVLPLRPMKILCTTAIILLLLHVLEISLWSSVYLMLPDLDELSTFEEAAYFSTVTFSSLGYGDLVIHGQWRLLSAFQAMTGLLIFGWSSAMFFAVVQRLWAAVGVDSQQS